MDTTLTIRTKKSLKNKASIILRKQGLTLSSGVNNYLLNLASGKINLFIDKIVDDKKMDEWEKEKNIAVKNNKSYNSVKEFMLSL